MRKYQPPTKEFFRLFNKIFTIPMTPIEFQLYAYLVCCAGSKGYCWLTMETIIRETGIKKSSLQKAIKVLQKRQLRVFGCNNYCRHSVPCYAEWRYLTIRSNKYNPCQIHPAIFVGFRE